MTDALATYLQDHLAGARFAVSLLRDLSEQKGATMVASFAAELLPEVEADRTALQVELSAHGREASTVREAAAWTAQKASRLKLTLTEPLGQFEAIEMLTLGVLGKAALWKALRAISQSESTWENLPLDNLLQRAQAQAEALEALRLKLAVVALAKADDVR